MKRLLALLLLWAFALSFSGCTAAAAPPDATLSTIPAATLPTMQTLPAPTVPAPVFVPSPSQRVLDLTEEEKTMLLKLGMAERGNCGCTECIALVMCTVLNRADSGRFGSSIRSVIHAQDQYTPVSNGSYFSAKPNENCYDALEMVLYGWDESQGALYYEWCEGESWHSQNLELLFQHCDIRFYH